MLNNNGNGRYLPSREIAYAYTVAMYFAQQLETDLRAILYTADYHGWGTDIELDEKELKRFKDAVTLIDEATCGLIINKLQSTGIFKNKADLKAFNRACKYRNRLAHSFLSTQDFDRMTKEEETNIIRDLEQMAIALYKALLISRAARRQVEHLADEDDQKMRALFKEFGGDCEDVNRHYATRTRKTKNSGKKDAH